MIVKCENLDDFGRGITYINNKITFVNNLLVNEVADVEIVLSKKKYAIGSVIELLEESDDRIIPKCPIEGCGCALKQLHYLKQLEFKKQRVKNLFYKFAKTDINVDKIIYDDNNGYRNKVSLKVQGKTGYYTNGSKEFIPINRCELVSDRVNVLIGILNDLDLSKVTGIVIKDFDEIMLIINGSLDINSFKNYVGTIYQNGKLVYGKGYVSTKLNNFVFKVSPNSFFQVNKFLTEKLYDVVLKYCGKDKKKTVLDLYCGTGTITLFLSRYFKKVIGVEINKEAVIWAEENKKINNIDNVDFICGDVSEVINNLKADIVVIDPARKGLSKDVINYLLKITPLKIIYVSCNPVTLSRDVGLLKEKYDVFDITLVDMFPNTYHVESVCVLKFKV